MTSSPTENNKQPRHMSVDTTQSSRHSVPVDAAADSIEPTADLPEQEIIRMRKKRKKHMKKKKKIVLAVVFVILAALVIAGIVFALSVQQAAKNATDYSNADISSTPEAVSTTGGKTVEYNGHTYQLNENMVSIVFMGVDNWAEQTGGAVPGQTDAVMVVAMDTKTGKTNVVAIPRDSMVDVDTYGTGGSYAGTSRMQLCLAYDYGDGEATSAQNVVKCIQRIMYDIPMKYYFALKLDGVGPMCDAVDGVSLTALQTIPDTTIYQGENVILLGNNAVKYVQYRDTSISGSALDRLARQRQFIQAFAQQVLAQSHGNVGNLVSLYNTISQYSNTNMSLSDYTYLATTIAGSGISDVNMTTLQGTLSMGEKYEEYNLDSSNVYQTVLDVYYTQVN